MKWTTIGGTAVALVLSVVSANAQSKTVNVTSEVLTATVEAIDVTNRQVTVSKPDKTYEVLYAPAGIKRFDTLKVGDKITARYYENIVLQVKAPGDKTVDSGARGIVRPEGVDAATASRQRTITATITAIDPKVPSITFTGPKDWKYSTKVRDRDALAKVKVGDKVDITWTEALVMSIEDAK